MPSALSHVGQGAEARGGWCFPMPERGGPGAPVLPGNCDPAVQVLGGCTLGQAVRKQRFEDGVGHPNQADRSAP